ncbi:LCP family protein (plasmid) [Streptomyces sp. BI20]|uniref:LCP family protein n=1 Tax=Streptomyces sp. BI20 TaxID=3403460 RepID=UPI003C739A4B
MRESRTARPRRARRPGRLRRALVWTASGAVLTVTGVSWAAYHSLVGGLTTSDALDALRGDGPRHLDNSVNVLLIGLDSRKDMNGNDLPKQFVEDELHAGSSKIGYYNTNTLILLHTPAGGGKVQAFSIPRDDYVETYNGDGSPQGKHKIKEAYGNAYSGAHDKLAARGVTGADLEARSREAGREATLRTVRTLLDVPIDHFAEANLLGFHDIAQVLQPITVCLKHPVKEKNSGADFPAGVSHLNARQALAFVRQRYDLPNGDLDRTHRQQAFLLSVTHQLKSQGVWGDLGKLRGLLDVVKKDLVIDSSWDVLDFARSAPNLTGGNVAFRTLPITGYATRGGESVNLVDAEKLPKIVRDAFADTPPPDTGETASPSAPPSGAPATPAPSPSHDADQDGAAGPAVESSGVPCVN